MIKVSRNNKLFFEQSDFRHTVHARVFNDFSLRNRMAKQMKMIWFHSRTLLLHISFSSIKVQKSPNAQLMVQRATNTCFLTSQKKQNISVCPIASCGQVF